MIQEANGQTTTGAPIHLNEMTFDDVYGRMGMVKFAPATAEPPQRSGARLRLLGKSASRCSWHGGTRELGTLVNFDDYTYWGSEVGQRFSFTRVRFTPYVGYLVGADRFGDIRGTFEGVPINATPGLAAQDGKFFEKSWALSVAPPVGWSSAWVRSR